MVTYKFFSCKETRNFYFIFFMSSLWLLRESFSKMVFFFHQEWERGKVIEHQFYQDGNRLCKKIWMALHVKKTLELKIALEINIFFLLCFRSVFITWCKCGYKFFCHKKGKILILPRVNDFCPKSVFHFFGSKVQG